MALLYLNLAVFGLIFTVLALVRVRQFRRVAYPIMVVSMLTGELALHRLALELVVTGLFAWLGVFANPAARLGLWLALLSWAGLLFVHAIAYRSRRVLAAEVARFGGPPVRYRPVGRRLLRPFRPLTAAFRIERDLAYGPALVRNQLDLYIPDGAGPFPMVVQIHGGSWLSGRKETQQQPLVRCLAQAGYLVAAITYRRGGEVRFPAHAEDVAAALRWIHANAARYGGDPRFVATLGGSAGAHLAALAALTDGGGYPPVQACVAVYGTFDLADRHRARGRFSLQRFLQHGVMPVPLAADPALWDSFSPITLVGPDAPPLLVVHGSLDVMLFREESAVFVDALRDVSRAPVGFAVLPGAQHAFDYWASVRSLAVADAVVAFLEAVRTATATRLDVARATIP